MTNEEASPESIGDDELSFPVDSQDTRIRDMFGDLYRQQPLIETGTSNADGNGEGSSCPTANGLGSADEGDEGSLPQTAQLPSTAPNPSASQERRNTGMGRSDEGSSPLTMPAERNLGRSDGGPF